MQKYDSVTVKDIRVVNPDGLYYPAGYVAVTTPGSGKTTWKPAREAIGTPIMNCHGLVYSATFTPGDQIGKPNNLHRNLCINPLNANSNKTILIITGLLHKSDIENFLKRKELASLCTLIPLQDALINPPIADF